MVPWADGEALAVPAVSVALATPAAPAGLAGPVILAVLVNPERQAPDRPLFKGGEAKEIFITKRIAGERRSSRPPGRRGTPLLRALAQRIWAHPLAEKTMCMPIPAGMSIAKTAMAVGNPRAGGNGLLPNLLVWGKMAGTSIARAKPAKILPVNLRGETIPVPVAVAAGAIPAPAGAVALMAVPVAEAVVAAEADAAKSGNSPKLLLEWNGFAMPEIF